MANRAPWFSALRDRVAYLAPWRRVYGKPDGFLPRLRCLWLGHKWWPCVEECCNRWWCERCLVSGPTLDKDPRVPNSQEQAT